MTLQAQIEGDDFDNFDACNDAIGSCDECGTNLYEDDCYYIDGSELCGQCAWHAMGCPEPTDEQEFEE